MTSYDASPALLVDLAVCRLYTISKKVFARDWVLEVKDKLLQSVDCNCAIYIYT